MREKLTKICDSFMGGRFDLPKTGLNVKLTQTQQNISETKLLLRQSKESLRNYLKTVNHIDNTTLVSSLIVCRWFVNKEKSLYEHLNRMRPQNHMFVGLFWCPLHSKDSIYYKISELKSEKQIDGPQIITLPNPSLPPPTHFRSNDFIGVFQQITNTYGVPAY